MAKKEEPYRPRYKGFDAEATRRAQETAARARKGAAAPGDYADRTYVEEGPREAARRMGTTPEEVEEDVERARRRR